MNGENHKWSTDWEEIHTNYVYCKPPYHILAITDEWKDSCLERPNLTFIRKNWNNHIRIIEYNLDKAVQMYPIFHKYEGFLHNCPSLSTESCLQTSVSLLRCRVYTVMQTWRYQSVLFTSKLVRPYTWDYHHANYPSNTLTCDPNKTACNTWLISLGITY